MPALRFANLGPTPGNSEVSAEGSLHVLLTEDSTTALVFDLRRYESNSSNSYKLEFKRIGPFEIPILPASRFRNRKKVCGSCNVPFGKALEKVRQVYVVNLSGEATAALGWEYLRRLFAKKTEISRVPLGRTDWLPVVQEETDRKMIHAIESTDLVDRGEKIKIGQLSLFLFRNKTAGRPASILVTGEATGRPFAFFFASNDFKSFFGSDCVDATTVRLHALNAGTWFAFYSFGESPPVKELIEQT